MLGRLKHHDPQAHHMLVAPVVFEERFQEKKVQRALKYLSK